MKTKWIKVVFGFSALYDGLLALTFLFFNAAIFDFFKVPQPNHSGYIHFPAMLMIVFALLYWRIALDPIKFRVLIPYGMGLKFSYCAVVFFHRITTGIPSMWLPFAWFDLFSLLLFYVSWMEVRKLPLVAEGGKASLTVEAKK
jgi:hypothetical protein